MAEHIFTSKAMKKLHTTDDMEQYVQGTSPRIWIILCACGSLIIGLLIWAFFGTAATVVETQAVLLDSEMKSFVSYQDFQLIRKGDKAYINEDPWTVSECAPAALSRDAAFTMIGSDFLYDKLIGQEKSFLVTYVPAGKGIAAEHATEGTPVSVTVYTQAVHPVDLILNR